MNKVIYIFIGSIIFVVSCSKEKKITTTTPVTLTFPGDLKASNFVIPEDNKFTKEGIALGRRLFYDPILSSTNTQSCGSCHHQKNGFVDPNKQFSIGVDGSIGKRNSMPIVNLGFQSSFFWDGRAKTLEEQALVPIEDPTEMKSSVPQAIAKLQAHPEYPALFNKAFGSSVITPSNLGKAIAQFERTIISGDSKYDKVKKGLATFTEQEQEGFTIFSDGNEITGGDCLHCHVIGSTFSDFDFRNNGLDEVLTDLGKYNVTKVEDDKGKFKTPSLRNIALTGPYMHDGRFKTLDEVMQHYNLHFSLNSPNLDPVMSIQIQGRLNKEKRDAVIAFMRTLTDSSLITNPAFSNPN
jgi:cytochrome c peroxidase